MRAQSNAWTDKEFDTLLGHVLRAGVFVAATVVFTGGVVYLLRHGHEVPDIACSAANLATCGRSAASCLTRGH